MALTSGNIAWTAPCSAWTAPCLDFAAGAHEGQALMPSPAHELDCAPQLASRASLSRVCTLADCILSGAQRLFMRDFTCGMGPRTTGESPMTKVAIATVCILPAAVLAWGVVAMLVCVVHAFLRTVGAA